ncbi:hypothetical protein BHE74_00002709 [Ensete ventricosum]|nr:hypothetical protein BHE74_00002709 [Ensete ventricosum]
MESLLGGSGGIGHAGSPPWFSHRSKVFTQPGWILEDPKGGRGQSGRELSRQMEEPRRGGFRPPVLEAGVQRSVGVEGGGGCGSYDRFVFRRGLGSDTKRAPWMEREELCFSTGTKVTHVARMGPTTHLGLS